MVACGNRAGEGGRGGGRGGRRSRSVDDPFDCQHQVSHCCAQELFLQALCLLLTAIGRWKERNTAGGRRAAAASDTQWAPRRRGESQAPLPEKPD